jgi:hypothetical protein
MFADLMYALDSKILMWLSLVSLGYAGALSMTKIVITGLVIVHLAASLWHGSAHTRLRRRTFDGAGSVRLHYGNHRPGRGCHTSLDALSINGPMAVLSLYAGKLSLWRIPTLCTRVARQYSPPAYRHFRISFPIHNQCRHNCIG